MCLSQKIETKPSSPDNILKRQNIKPFVTFADGLGGCRETCDNSTEILYEQRFWLQPELNT